MKIFSININNPKNQKSNYCVATKPKHVAFTAKNLNEAILDTLEKVSKEATPDEISAEGKIYLISGVNKFLAGIQKAYLTISEKSKFMKLNYVASDGLQSNDEAIEPLTVLSNNHKQKLAADIKERLALQSSNYLFE